jgi:DNA modification methylase
MNFTVNKLILGDNLDILKTLDAESVDLIYLDPPFFSNRNYEIIWGDENEKRSFQDYWAGGINHYVEWLKIRVEEMHRVLKNTGSIFLHCDWHADAYIRVYIMDKIFGESNFRGEIIWKRHNAHNDAKNKLAVLADTIWYYSKTDNCIYNPIYGTLNEKYTEDFYKYDDNDGKGKYSLGDLTNTRPGGYNYVYKGYKPNENGWRCPVETMREWDAEGKIYFPKLKEQRLRIKRYFNDSKGQLLGNVWTDINNVQSGNERIGYPTQKPEALLERIIQCASNEGDVVLDPFMGGGTSIIAAEKLNRRWLGIDQSAQAVKVTEFRLNKYQSGGNKYAKNLQDKETEQTLFYTPFIVQLHKYDFERLRAMDAFEFETLIITQFGGIPQNKKGADKGIDGKMPDRTPIQVKRSDRIGRVVLDSFISSAQRYDEALFKKNIFEKKPAGYIIAFSFTTDIVDEVARLNLEKGIIIKLMRVNEILPITDKPNVNVDAKQMPDGNIELTALGGSPAGIGFFSWDFNYDNSQFKPAVLRDETGKQIIRLESGVHYIACKIVDNDGLENIDVIKLTVNGELRKH